MPKKSNPVVFQPVPTKVDLSTVEAGKAAVRNSLIDVDTFEDTFGIPYTEE